MTLSIIRVKNFSDCQKHTEMLADIANSITRHGADPSAVVMTAPCKNDGLAHIGWKSNGKNENLVALYASSYALQKKLLDEILELPMTAEEREYWQSHRKSVLAHHDSLWGKSKKQAE